MRTFLLALLCALALGASATLTAGQTSAVEAVTKLQQDINTHFGGGSDVQTLITALEATKTEVKADSSFDASTFNSAVAGVGGQLYALRKGDKYQKAIAGLKILQTVSAAVGGPIGGPVSSVFAVSATLLAMATGNDKSQSEVFDELIKKNIKQQYQNEMMDGIAGARRVIAQTHSTVKSYLATDWSKMDKDRRFHSLTQLLGQVQLKEGLDLLGRMEQYIRREGAAAADEAAVNGILKVMEGYSIITSSRVFMLHELLTVVTRNGESPDFLRAVQETISLTQDDARGFLTDAIASPRDSLAHIAAGFYPDEFQAIAALMRALNLDPKSATPGVDPAKCYKIKLAKDNAWYLYAKMSALPHVTKADKITSYYAIGGTKKSANAAKGKWKFSRKPDSTDYQITNTYQPGKPVKVSSSLHELWLDWTIDAKNKALSEKHDFRVVKTESGKYFMVSKIRRGHPIQMITTLFNKAAYTAKSKGDAMPGDQSLWQFEPVAC